LTEVPTIAESAIPNMKLLWYGFLVPQRSRTGTWYARAVTSFKLKDKLPAQGFFLVGVCDTGFGNFLREQYAAYGRVNREANIRAD
jgi:hypothetical protein